MMLNEYAIGQELKTCSLLLTSCYSFTSINWTNGCWDGGRSYINRANSEFTIGMYFSCIILNWSSILNCYFILLLRLANPISPGVQWQCMFGVNCVVWCVSVQHNCQLQIEQMLDDNYPYLWATMHSC